MGRERDGKSEMGRVRWEEREETGREGGDGKRGRRWKEREEIGREENEKEEMGREEDGRERWGDRKRDEKKGRMNMERRNMTKVSRPNLNLLYLITLSNNVPNHSCCSNQALVDNYFPM